MSVDFWVAGSEERWHVVPVDDLREHNSSKTCWCHPTPDDEDPGIYVHHSMDQREEYEKGRPLQ